MFASVPLVLAFSFTSTEQQIIGWALVFFSTMSALGYGMYKLVHLLKENWSHIDSGGKNALDFYYDRREQIVRRRAALSHLKQELRTGNCGVEPSP